MRYIALEQIMLKEWKYVKSFLQYYFFFTVISGNTLNREIYERLSKKLPRKLGREIEDIWEKTLFFLFQDWNPTNEYMFKKAIRVYLIIQVLKDKCMQIDVQRQLKGEYIYC